MKDRKGIDSEKMGDGEDLGEEEGGETITRIYYVIKEAIFMRRKKLRIGKNIFLFVLVPLEARRGHKISWS